MQGRHYHIHPCKTSRMRFYSSVILNGTETVGVDEVVVLAFYSSVILLRPFKSRQHTECGYLL